ncbi:hypothetical protein [Massilia consociata]|uniref:Uncharacterized protein n=1 Tax=Massilia consociata TaxID=760117 RepID=A0ABV6FHN4_9BURK
MHHQVLPRRLAPAVASAIRPVVALPRRLQAAALVLLSSLSIPGQAGRPMITDDAGIVDPRACQLETWTQRGPRARAFWAVPACNFTGKLELALGAGRSSGADDAGSMAVLQGKTLFKAMDTNGWGVGLVFGTQFTRSGERSTDRYAFVPLSHSFHDDRLLVHTNLGWLREGLQNRHRATWGIGSELRAGERTWLTTEAFGQSGSKPSYQLGFRHWIVPERVQVDGTYGRHAMDCGRERQISIGLKFVTDRILP